MAEIKSRGLFWWREGALPDREIAPASSVAGELSISDGGRIELVLDGYLDRGQGREQWAVLPSAEEVADTRARTIEGRLIRENKQVLLFGLSKGRGTSFKSSGVSTEGFLAEHCLISDGWGVRWLPSAIKSIELNLTSLLQWVRYRPFKLDRETRTLCLQDFEPREYTTQIGCLSISGSSAATHPINYESEGSFYSEAALALKTNGTEELDFEAVAKLFRLFQELFIILTDSEQCLPFPKIEAEFDGEIYRFQYFCARLYNESEAPEWYALPTNLDMLSEVFGSIIDKWFSQRERFGPGYYLYLGTRRGMSLYTENKFWSLITGLESFHTTKFGAEASDKLAKKIDRILGQIQRRKDRDWAEGVLTRELLPKLHERVAEVVLSLPLDLDLNRVGEFSRSCGKSRNDLAHFGSNRDGLHYTHFIEDLARKIEALGSLYHVLMLQEIGVPETHIRRWFFNGPVSFRRREALLAVGLLTIGEARDFGRNSSS